MIYVWFTLDALISVIFGSPHAAILSEKALNFLSREKMFSNQLVNTVGHLAA